MAYQRIALTCVLWIGGAPDSGKTTIARALANKHGLSLYEYDRADVAHHLRLVESSAEYVDFMKASLDERWLAPSPEELAARALKSFEDRFPMVIEDLESLIADGCPVIAEGFGLTPDLIAPLLTDRHQGIWFVPTAPFKEASMRRRNKPSFGNRVSDVERARRNMLDRDLLLAGIITAQARSLGLTLVDVDLANSLQEMLELVERQFQPFLPNKLY